MAWVIVAVLLVVVLGALFFACAVSTPRRPAQPYVTNSYAAATATLGAAALAIVAALVVSVQ